MKISSEVLMWTGGAILITGIVVTAAKVWFGAQTVPMLARLLSGLAS